MTTARVPRPSRALLVAIALLMAACAAPPARIASPASTLAPAATLAATPVITATPEVTNEPSPTTPVAADDVEIVFEVSGGFAGRYESWTIRGDGRVQRNTGETYAVVPERVAQLLDEVEDAGFSDLSAHYDEVSCADCFVYYIAVTRDGQTKSVEAVDANQLPQPLRDIITSLRGFVGSLG